MNMNENPMVSVIVPVYNGEMHIVNLLNTLAIQEYSNFELVIVDDGSFDNTYKTIEYNKNKYAYEINTIKQQNAGVSAARNTGILAAKGEYICFVDVDDSLESDYISLMAETLFEKKAELVICKFGHSSNPRKNEKIEVLEYDSINALKMFLFGEIVTGVWSLMVSAQLLRDNKLLFAEGFKYSEDLHMVWRIITYSKKVLLLDRALYIYNDTENSAMNKFGEDRFHSIELINQLNGFFRDNKPEFYPYFNKYGKSRMAWSLLWQSVKYKNREEFIDFVNLYDFKSDLKKLLTFKDLKVALSSLLFLTSKSAFYSAVKFYVNKKVK